MLRANLPLIIFLLSINLSAISQTITPPPILAVGDPTKAPASAIVIPPATSWSGTISMVGPHTPVAPATDVSSWVSAQLIQIGLSAITIPWHLIVNYDQYDEDGDNVHSGTFEELWAGPQRYKSTYTTDDFNQTDYATPQGLYRLGDQKWPNTAQTQVATAILNPFTYAATLSGVHLISEPETFETYTLNCTKVENAPGHMASPTEYCFDITTSALRYVRGESWQQITYNDPMTFADHSVARSINIYEGGKPYLSIRIQLLETPSELDDSILHPPSDARNLNNQVLTGVRPIPVYQPLFPQWPDSLRQQHFLITLEILIGKDGKVKTAHALSGPPEAYKAAEANARQWRFQPFMVLKQPAEVSTKIQLQNN